MPQYGDVIGVFATPEARQKAAAVLMLYGCEKGSP
jgi:hypothetical protein